MYAQESITLISKLLPGNPCLASPPVIGATNVPDRGGLGICAHLFVLMLLAVRAILCRQKRSYKDGVPVTANGTVSIRPSYQEPLNQLNNKRPSRPPRSLSPSLRIKSFSCNLLLLLVLFCKIQSTEGSPLSPEHNSLII